MSESGTGRPEPVENIHKWLDSEVQQVDYLLWSHGASNALRARVTAEMRDEEPPEWAVEAAGDLGQPKPPAECPRDTDMEPDPDERDNPRA